MKTKSSSVWKYFNEVSADKAKCKLCLKVYSRKGKTTSSLKSHLKSMHVAEYDQYNQLEVKKINALPSTSAAASFQEPEVQKTFEETNQKWCNNNPKSMEIDRLISEMIALQDLPMDFVEGVGFRRLMQFVAPNYQLSGRRFSTDYNTCEDSDSPDSSWSYFERTDTGARCAVCREPVPSSGRRRHLQEHHPKLLDKAESEEDMTNDAQEEVYTELVFLENEESPKKTIKTEQRETVTVVKTPRKTADTRKRRVSSSSDEEPLNNNKRRNEDEIEQFTKYITCLLKKLPQDTCTELQMDIVNLILKKQLELKRKETSVLAGNKMAAGQSTDDTLVKEKRFGNGYACSDDNIVNAEKINE